MKTIIPILGLMLCLQGETIAQNISNPDLNKYQEIYTDYKAAISETIQSNIKDLESVTLEFFEDRNMVLFAVVVSNIKPTGEWQYLVRWLNSEKEIALPKIRYPYSSNVHISLQVDKREGQYILIESNRLEDGSYEDNLYIRIALESE